MRQYLQTFVVATLAALVLVTGAVGDDGLPVGQDFAIPIVVDGKAAEGLAYITADKVLRIHYVKAGKIAVLTYTVTRGGDVKPPPVPPTPQPGPTPSKITAIYVVHESGDGTPAFTAIRNAAAWKSEADRLGIKWLVVDVDTARPKLPQAVKLAVAKGLPAIVLLDAQGLGVAEACPKTPDAMLARVKAAGGKP